MKSPSRVFFFDKVWNQVPGSLAVLLRQGHATLVSWFCSGPVAQWQRCQFFFSFFGEGFGLILASAMWSPLTPIGGGGVLSNVAEPSFFGKGSPLKSTNQNKWMPFLSMATGHLRQCCLWPLATLASTIGTRA